MRRSTIVAMRLRGLIGVAVVAAFAVGSAGARPAASLVSINSVAMCLARSGQVDSLDWYVRGLGRRGWTRGHGMRDPYRGPLFRTTLLARRGWIHVEFRRARGLHPNFADLLFAASPPQVYFLARRVLREYGSYLRLSLVFVM